jgi:hypothetical protein
MGNSWPERGCDTSMLRMEFPSSYRRYPQTPRSSTLSTNAARTTKANERRNGLSRSDLVLWHLSTVRRAATSR